MGFGFRVLGFGFRDMCEMSTLCYLQTLGANPRSVSSCLLLNWTLRTLGRWGAERGGVQPSLRTTQCMVQGLRAQVLGA